MIGCEGKQYACAINKEGQCGCSPLQEGLGLPDEVSVLFTGA